MEIEKLIERLEAWNEQHLSVVCGNGHFACDYLCENEDCIVVRAATALEQLQAENDRLQAELEKEEAARKKQADILYELRGQKYEQTTAIDQLRAENERLKRGRDAAVESIPHECKTCLYYTVSFNGCTPDYDCTNLDGGCSNNYDRWVWRGLHKEE